ncbi:unnamed protein product [Protopolystoma xenopodis]|uniref:Uncharacterized protein n=1 Tax=Protopolystoma xenopodis TaxID=117903 RepID=A0A3S5AZA9_9PLAT|nr:unnamed protein product [Protopolystoma xenopodis]
MPAGKRFWRQLRNLADTIELDMHCPRAHCPPGHRSPSSTTITTTADDGLLPVVRPHPVRGAPYSSHPLPTPLPPPNRLAEMPRLHRLRATRTRHARRLTPKPPGDVLAKAWSLLQSTWRNRPVLLAQAASLVNTLQKPFSGFEEVGLGFLSIWENVLYRII